MKNKNQTGLKNVKAKINLNYNIYTGTICFVVSLGVICSSKFVVSRKRKNISYHYSFRETETNVTHYICLLTQGDSNKKFLRKAYKKSSSILRFRKSTTAELDTKMCLTVIIE